MKFFVYSRSTYFYIKMSSFEDNLNEEKLNSKIVQKLVEAMEYNSNSTTGSTRSKNRRKGIFISVEDIPIDLDELDQISSIVYAYNVNL
jgi:hypothetical protein